MAIALYARKSVERENSISCETQIEYCKAMIKPDERNEEVAIFVDNGFSGGNLERDGFQKMLKQVKMGKITKIIVYRLDRISRSLGDFVNILNILKEHNVKFISSQESFDTSSPYGEMIVKILMVFAEFERKSIIERVTQAYAHRSEMGFYMGGRKPYGFKLEPTEINNIKTKKLSPIPEEIEHIKYIYKLYSVENVTLGRLLKNLTENEIRCLSGEGWTTSKLSTIIKNPIYVRADYNLYEYLQKLNVHIISSPEAFDGICGVQFYGKTKHSPEDKDWSDVKAVVMSHEGVIESDVWIKCQKKLSKNKQLRNSVVNKTSWLGGKVVCECCGKTMTTIKSSLKDSGIRRYFNCTGKSHYKNCTGPSVTVYADSLEKVIYHEIGEKLEKIRGIKSTKSKALNPEINILRNKLKSLELDEERIADAILSSEINAELLDILNARAEKIKLSKVEILTKIEEFESLSREVKSAVNLSENWKSASFEEKRSICAILIDRILINKDGNVEIVWRI